MYTSMWLRKVSWLQRLSFPHTMHFSGLHISGCTCVVMCHSTSRSKFNHLLWRQTSDYVKHCSWNTFEIPFGSGLEVDFSANFSKSMLGLSPLEVASGVRPSGCLTNSSLLCSEFLEDDFFRTIFFGCDPNFSLRTLALLFFLRFCKKKCLWLCYSKTDHYNVVMWGP